MKKVLIATAVLGMAYASFGQGEINFANSTTTRISTNATAGGPTTGQINTPGNGSLFYFALFSANPSVGSVVNGSNPGAILTDTNWSFTGNYGTNTLLGRFNGDYTTGTSVIVPGYAPLTSASFAVIGWSANLGQSIAQLAAFFQNPSSSGISQYYWCQGVGQNLALGGGAVAASSLFGPSPLIGSMTMGLVIVPEPATVTLVGLGAAALLILRRRR